MKYIKRKAEAKFLRMNNFFKVILLTGARQVGKSTMLKKLAENEERTYVTLDDKNVRALAKTDPKLFFQRYRLPIIIDEVQYAPELFEEIKILADTTDLPGQIWLTGSQQYQMMSRVQESLAGRVGIMNLYSMTQNEIAEIDFEEDLNFTAEQFIARRNLVGAPNVNQVFQTIWAGGMPQLVHADSEMREMYYQSYVNTYLLRDVMELGGVSDSLKFTQFLKACAALTSEQVNYKTLSDAANISQPTAKEWLRLLEGLGIIYLLRPFANNELKRLSKTPKLYFCDTGLAAHLSMWLTSETLLLGAASGHYFENYVVMELVKNAEYGKTPMNFTYFRDSNKKEIDVVVEIGQTLHPLEIKQSATPKFQEVRKFSVLEKTALTLGNGGIICLSDEVLPVAENQWLIPCNII